LCVKLLIIDASLLTYNLLRQSILKLYNVHTLRADIQQFECALFALMLC